jgi:two-component system OmpR family response regulator
MHDTGEQKTAIRRILIIEDEGDMCLLLNLLLDGQDIEVNHVQTLSAAREYLQNEQPSLILLDNRLPDGFGIDFLSFLKTNYPLIKIIMISGVDIEAEDAALEIGADHFLAKPFTKAQLDESISKLLN